MPLLTLNLSCENVKYPAQKHFEKTNITNISITTTMITTITIKLIMITTTSKNNDNNNHMTITKLDNNAINNYKNDTNNNIFQAMLKAEGYVSFTSERELYRNVHTRSENPKVTFDQSVPFYFCSNIRTVCKM